MKVKTDQKELQSAVLELGTYLLHRFQMVNDLEAYYNTEQTESDIENAGSTVEQAKENVAELRVELEKLMKQFKKSEVCNPSNVMMHASLILHL